MITKYIKYALVTVNLPLFCALLFDAHISFLSLAANSVSIYMVIVLIIESLPFFIAHHFAYKASRYKSVLIWLLGFGCYPVLSLTLSTQSTTFDSWSLFNTQSWELYILASTACYINYVLKIRNKTRSIQFLVKLFSLNMVIALLLFGWAVIMAGVFNSVQDPNDNQSLNAIIDITNIFVESGTFFNFLWQFLIVAMLIGGVYSLNRYGLIRQILAKQGILAFITATLISIIIITPAFASFLLWLPLNTPNITLFPGDQHQLFAPINYQWLFWLFAITTPLILVFERQQQDKILIQIAQQQTQTELKLLQQQINPHFLFNTLNNLYSLTLTKSDDAPNLVMQLSNLLRYTVYEGQKEHVTLAQESNYLKDYIALQQIRSHDKCTFDLKWPEHDDKFTLPPLLIIMLLENAFKHGVEPSIDQSYIRFHMQLNNNILSVVCQNPLSSHKQNTISGLGLENLRRRLALLYPEKHTLVTGPKDNLWHAEMTLELTPC